MLYYSGSFSVPVLGLQQKRRLEVFFLTLAGRIPIAVPGVLRKHAA